MTSKAQEGLECVVCLNTLAYVPSRRGRKQPVHCFLKNCEPGEKCWALKSVIHSYVVQAMLARPPRIKSLAQSKERLLLELIKSLDRGNIAVDSFFCSLTDHERAVLLKYTVDELHVWLQQKYQQLKLEAQEDIMDVIYPELPSRLLSTLREWEGGNRTRLQRRVSNGFSRHPRSLIRMMSEPIRLAITLQENGKECWSQLALSDQLEFAKKHGKSTAAKLRPFMSFLETKSIFKSKTYQLPQKRNHNIFQETHGVFYLRPDELEQRLSDARSELEPKEFLIFWLVAKMGLSLSRAYELTPQQVMKETRGGLIFKPANTWTPLPPNLANILENLVREVDPGWPYSNPEEALSGSLLKNVLSYRQAARIIFKHEVNLLRTSALMALLLKGMMDRKTLSNLTGASWPTLRTLEFQLSADIHSLASHALVAARNKVILGDGNDQ